MDMKLSDYIQNPMGVKNGVFTQRDMYKNIYTDKLNKILVRETGRIAYFLYINKDKYIIHLKIPSEVIEKFYYDVVLEFSTKDPDIAASAQLNDYNVKFYSNDPAFVYTFAFAFLKNQIFIKELVPRMSKTAVQNAAAVKNPKNEVGYVKSLYFAYLVIKNYGLMKKVQFTTLHRPYNLNLLLQSIEHADVKVAKRQKAQEVLNATKKKEKADKKTIDTRVRGNTSTNTKTTNVIGRVGSVSKNIKKTNVIGGSNRTSSNVKKSITTKIK